MAVQKPTIPPQNPLGNPKAFRGYSTRLKALAASEKRSDFLPPFESSVGSFLVELLKIVIIAFAIIIPVRYYILQPFYVKGASMEPNFHDNEYLIIDELSYRLHEPKRGDVVVLRNPNLSSEFFIKRVIGLPGETVVINDGYVMITDTAGRSGILDESAYLPPNRTTFGHLEISLASDEYFVLGDNRQASLDSRSFGPIRDKEIIGRTALRAWPVSRVRSFSTPTIPFSSTDDTTSSS